MGSHINTFFKGNPYSMDHLFSETCVLSLASSQTGEQLRSKKLYESSPHCMLWHWRSPQDEMQFQGKQKEIGNCTWEVSAGSQSISFGLSLSTNQLTSKRSHGTWQPCRSFIASLQSITALLPWESTPSWWWAMCWKTGQKTLFSIDMSYLLLDNVT